MIAASARRPSAATADPAIKLRPMYVESVVIDGVRLIDHLELDFTRSDGSIRPWTLLLGPNGSGKSTVLQAIALASVGPTRANQLANVKSLLDRRDSNRPALIKAVVQPTVPAVAGVARVASSLEVRPDASLVRGSSRVIAGRSNGDPIEAAQEARAPGWFIAAYGVRRDLPLALTRAPVADPVLDRLRPLFTSDAAVIGTGFADTFEPETARRFARFLKEALVTSGLLPLVRDLDLRGRGGAGTAAALVESNRFDFGLDDHDVRLPATWLSHGYQATIAWIADLIGQAMSEQPIEQLADIAGLVLVDELDLLLHPRWQVELVPALKRIFPAVQFVTTTHSPMLLPGCEADEVYQLSFDAQTNITAKPAHASPKLLTGSELYSIFFGIDDLYPNELGEDLREYSFLAGNPRRSPEEEQTLARVLERLRDAGIEPEFEPVTSSPPR